MAARPATGRTIWGLILLALGTLFVLDQLNLARTGRRRRHLVADDPDRARRMGAGHLAGSWGP
ncbi:MAG TPA: hypothetical protein VHF25_12785 [Nitriliruptorales bacterium]|nr:hypothetical protein [Nitriliruptorales bacterium]